MKEYYNVKYLNKIMIIIIIMDIYIFLDDLAIKSTHLLLCLIVTFILYFFFILVDIG